MKPNSNTHTRIKTKSLRRTKSVIKIVCSLFALQVQTPICYMNEWGKGKVFCRRNTFRKKKRATNRCKKRRSLVKSLARSPDKKLASVRVLKSGGSFSMIRAQGETNKDDKSNIDV